MVIIYESEDKMCCVSKLQIGVTFEQYFTLHMYYKSLKT